MAAERAPERRAPANKGRRFPAELLSPEEVRALLRACSSRAPTGIRNRALIAVLYRGGLRISEALALHVKDVDQGAGTVTVLHGKGDQRRTVGMDPAAFALLERWLDKCRALGLSARRPIFCTLRGEAIDSSRPPTQQASPRRLCAAAWIAARSAPCCAMGCVASPAPSSSGRVSLLSESRQRVRGRRQPRGTPSRWSRSSIASCQAGELAELRVLTREADTLREERYRRWAKSP